MRRCAWAGTDPLMLGYHDVEWGVPVHDDRRLYEFLVLEGAQAGLSWITILRKREGYRAAFADFEARAVASYGPQQVAGLLESATIVRNRRKVESAIANARVVNAIIEELGSFDRYVWSFVGGRPRRNGWRSMAEVPSQADESRAMSKDLRSRGASFVGPTICYAFMQATGLFNDHLVDCFRYKEIDSS